MPRAPTSPLPGPETQTDLVRIVIAGHVDHGKSTLVGRLLADVDALPAGRLESVRALCERAGRPFEYAFLLDALQDERSQGVTIDTARVHFRHGGRRYLLLDAPGHPEFLRNMVTGASRADAALLVVDAARGVEANTRRHGHLLGVLGIRQTIVVVSKMDLVEYGQGRFDEVARDAASLLSSAGVGVVATIPVSATHGDGVTGWSTQLSWYHGPPLLGLLGGLRAPPPATERPLRVPVQAVYRFGRQGDGRRIVAGTVESGSLAEGDELEFYPSGKRSAVATLEGFPGAPDRYFAGQAAGFTLREPLYLMRGEVATRLGEPRPAVTTRFRATLIWLGAEPLTPGRDYLLRLGTARVAARIERILSAFDPVTLARDDQPAVVERHGIGDCVLRLRRAIALEASDVIAALGRFVLVDDFDIRGGGIVREVLPDAHDGAREQALQRNAAWESSLVSPDRRAERYRHIPALVVLTGPATTDRKSLGKAVEARLFEDGCAVYFMGMGNLLRGVDADLARTHAERSEHMRRLGEVANLLLDAGHILVATAAELAAQDLDLIEAALPGRTIVTAWLGPAPEGMTYDLVLSPQESTPALVERLREHLALMGILRGPG